jgi:menaquinone-dependent protoporphyrinogen oxidase
VVKLFSVGHRRLHERVERGPTRDESGAGVTAERLRVLVTWASKHGSTSEIAAAVARGLESCDAGRAGGLVASAVPVEQRPDATGFDAVVLGSAVYVGRWREEARHYAAEHATALRSRPVWLFSSGPIGEPPFPSDEPYDAEPLSQLVAARGHRVFPGRLDKQLLTFGERAMVTAMRAPVGDSRDWAAVASWAEEIATALSLERAGLRS